jgi:hypothetical protein
MATWDLRLPWEYRCISSPFHDWPFIRARKLEFMASVLSAPLFGRSPNFWSLLMKKFSGRWQHWSLFQPFEMDGLTATDPSFNWFIPSESWIKPVRTVIRVCRWASFLFGHLKTACKHSNSGLQMSFFREPEKFWTKSALILRKQFSGRRTRD